MVAWATAALDEVRRQVWPTAETISVTSTMKRIEGCRSTLLKNPGDLTATQRDRLSWARRCRIPEFVELYHRLVKHRPTIEATLTHGLSNALVEATNTKIRVLAPMAYGFKHPEYLITLTLLDRGGYCPPLPGRIPYQ